MIGRHVGRGTFGRPQLRLHCGSLYVERTIAPAELCRVAHEAIPLAVLEQQVRSYQRALNRAGVPLPARFEVRRHQSRLVLRYRFVAGETLAGWLEGQDDLRRCEPPILSVFAHVAALRDLTRAYLIDLTAHNFVVTKPGRATLVDLFPVLTPGRIIPHNNGPTRPIDQLKCRRDAATALFCGEVAKRTILGARFGDPGAAREQTARGFIATVVAAARQLLGPSATQWTANPLAQEGLLVVPALRWRALAAFASNDIDRETLRHTLRTTSTAHLRTQGANLGKSIEMLRCLHRQ